MRCQSNNNRANGQHRWNSDASRNDQSGTRPRVAGSDNLVRDADFENPAGAGWTWVAGGGNNTAFWFDVGAGYGFGRDFYGDFSRRTAHDGHEWVDGWACSPRQKGCVLKIVNEHHLDKTMVEALAKERFGKSVRDLNKPETSALIVELLALPNSRDQQASTDPGPRTKAAAPQ